MMKKILAILTAVCMLCSVIPIFAAENDQVKIVFSDVTAEDVTALSGEAKIKVSVEGLSGKVSIAQLDLAFAGDLSYKSITFLQGKNAPEEGSTLVSPNPVTANLKGRITPSIISMKTPIAVEGNTDLFVLTFAGEPGEKAELSLNNLKDSYFTVGEKDINPAGKASIEVQAGSQDNHGVEAEVRLIMDKVEDFVGGSDKEEYLGTGIEVKIINEKNPGNVLYTELNNIPVSKGGHRDAGVTTPTFRFADTVLDGNRYTVEISGIGYVTCKKTGVTFDRPVEFRNDAFIPGDVNGDGAVDATDKKLCNEAIEAGETGLNTDFNRDGKTDRYDLVVFDGISGETEGTPGKMKRPSLQGGSKRITVSWEKPEEEGITGYVIQYGTEEDNLKRTKEVENPDRESTVISELVSGTTYYVRIAARNEKGTGEFSEIVRGKTNSDSGIGGTGGTGGGNGGNGGTGGNSGNGSQSKPETNDRSFTDLEGYDWAEDAIYQLKDMGIISGISATEFAPANNIKRGDFILILVRMLGIDHEFSENFADVPADSYYYDAIGKAKAAGIAKGSGENFMPEDSITRQDLITLAYRAFLEKGYISQAEDAASLEAFADRAMISDYAAMAMASMVSAGIIQGSDGNVNPLGNAIRAEVAVMCARMTDLMN